MPITGSCPVVGRPSIRTSRHPVFSCGLHHTAVHCSYCPSKQGDRLRHSIPAASETLRTIAADPKHLGAQIGFFAVLHTWGQALFHHPHLHCVVPGGGISPDGTRWISCRRKFFLPVLVLARLFRRLFIDYLRK